MKKLDEAYKEYEEKARPVNREDTLYKIMSICNKDAIRRDISEGLKDIFESYVRKEELPENLSERILVFFLFMEKLKNIPCRKL